MRRTTREKIAEMFAGAALLPYLPVSADDGPKYRRAPARMHWMRREKNRAAVRQQQAADARKARFVAAYNANPINFLPSVIVFHMLRTPPLKHASQSAKERWAAQWIAEYNEMRKSVRAALIPWPVTR